MAAAIVLVTPALAGAAPPLPQVEVGSPDQAPTLVQRCSGGFFQQPAVVNLGRTGDTSSPLTVSFTVTGPVTPNVSSPVTFEIGQYSYAIFLTPDLSAQQDDAVTLALQPGDGYDVGPNHTMHTAVNLTSEDCHYPVSVGSVTDGLAAWVDCAGNDVPAVPGQIKVQRPDAATQIVVVSYTYNDAPGTFTFFGANSFRFLSFDQPGHFQLIDGSEYDLGTPSEADVGLTPQTPDCGPPGGVGGAQLARTGPAHLAELSAIAVALLLVGTALLHLSRNRRHAAS